MCRGSGSSVTTCSPILSCRSISTFRFVTCLSSLARHPDVARVLKIINHFGQLSSPRTPDHHRVSTRGCLVYHGSASTVMISYHRSLTAVLKNSSQALAASRVPCRVRNRFQRVLACCPWSAAVCRALVHSGDGDAHVVRPARASSVLLVRFVMDPSCAFGLVTTCTSVIPTFYSLFSMI